MKEKNSICKFGTGEISALNMIMGDIFKEIRTGCDIHKSDIAVQLNITLNHLNLIESGNQKPTLAQIIKFCGVFKLDPVIFFIWCYEKSNQIGQTKLQLIDSNSDSILNDHDSQLHVDYYFNQD